MKLKNMLGALGVDLDVSAQALETGEFVVSDLEQDPKAMMVTDGVCKVVLLLEAGKEITKSFLTPGDVAITPYRLNKDYAVFVQAITPVSFESVDYLAIRKASETNKALQQAISGRWTQYESQKEDRFVIDQTLPSVERYQLVVERLGEWADKVPLLEIAAYLGITPVQLSRIRRRSR
ncbi:MAG: Crp/Fnr family transcriptional regulator [Pseudomonadales bacterium]